MLDFKTMKFLAAVFTPELTISNSLKIANTVVDLIGKYVGQEPTILPIEQNAPPEIPRLLFNPPESKWSLNISLARTDLFYQPDPFTSDTGLSEEEFAEVASNFFVAFQQALDFRVQRIAFVSERLSVQNDALTYVQERFCNEDQIKGSRAFHNAERFEIHSMKKYSWEDFNINSWVRIKVQNIIKKDGESVPSIILVNDLNTMSLNEAKDQRFSPKEIKQFYDKIPAELGKIVKLYFDKVADGDQ